MLEESYQENLHGLRDEIDLLVFKYKTLKKCIQSKVRARCLAANRCANEHASKKDESEDDDDEDDDDDVSIQS